MLAFLLALALWIGPILPTPVPLMTFEDFRAEVAPGGAVVSWRGTGGDWCISAPQETFCQRFAAGSNRIGVSARWGDTVILRDAPGVVLASGRVVGRLYFPYVAR